MKKAVIENGRVVNIIEVADEGFALPGYELAAFDENCQIGAVYADGYFSYEPPPEILDKEAVLASLRYERETGGLEIGAVHMRTDRETQAMLLAVRTAAKENPDYTVTWKAENGFTVLTAFQIIEIADAVHGHVQACFAAESAVDLDECETYAAVADAFAAAYVALRPGA